MRLHTDKITTQDLYNALFAAKDNRKVAESVYFDVLDQKVSRSKVRGFEIQLSSSQKIEGDKRRFKNSGKFGAADDYSATHDEWGFFIAELFKLDPEAIFGFYKSKDDFHAQTVGAYEAPGGLSLIPR